MYKKTTCFKWTNENSGDDYRVATPSKSYLTTTRLKSIEQFEPANNEKSYPIRTDGPTLIIERQVLKV